MKVFIIAYACEPYKGSEPGIGWNMSIELSKHQDVHLLTRENNKHVIEEYLFNNENPSITFHYYDPPRWLTFWKKKRRGMHLYYYLWQLLGYFKFKKFIRDNQFEIVHHLTFGNNWMPSLFMLVKESKTIWGPIGSEDTYQPILEGLAIQYKIKERIRYGIRLFFYYFEPLRYLTMIKSNVILDHSSRYAKYKYPKYISDKVYKCIQTGINIHDNEYKNLRVKEKKRGITFIIASELVGWKGVLISTEIFVRLSKKYDNIDLVVIGEGPEYQRMSENLNSNNLLKRVEFKGYVSKNILMSELNSADILLYPSYHHGLATLVLQAMNAYLPILSVEGDIICEVIENKCGLVGRGNNYKEIIDDLTSKGEALILDNELRNQFAQNGKKLIEQKYNWEKLAVSMCKLYTNLNEQ